MVRAGAWLQVETAEVEPEGPRYQAAVGALNGLGRRLQEALDRCGGPGARTVGPLYRRAALEGGVWRWRLTLAVPGAAVELARHLAQDSGVSFLQVRGRPRAPVACAHPPG